MAQTLSEMVCAISDLLNNGSEKDTYIASLIKSELEDIERGYTFCHMESVEQVTSPKGGDFSLTGNVKAVLGVASTFDKVCRCDYDLQMFKLGLKYRVKGHCGTLFLRAAKYSSLSTPDTIVPLCGLVMQRVLLMMGQFNSDIDSIRIAEAIATRKYEDAIAADEEARYAAADTGSWADGNPEC